MELVSFGKEVLQNIAEQAASYRLGQSALRHLDRALWVVEKCARWAVPPPLDQDDRPQPELVRPLPWVFFLALLITLRVTRESISLVNLVMGKPPLRSADVVMYIQSKRRYLRTLKYQGSRTMRARATPAQAPWSWVARAQALLDQALCLRRPRLNNNTTQRTNNDEVLVVKRSKRVRAGAAAGAGAGAAGDATMERLIEKMMVDLDADSDDDSSFTLTNVTSVRSDTDMADSDQETIMNNDTSSSQSNTISEPRRPSGEINFSPNRSAVSTPERPNSPRINQSEHNTSPKKEEERTPLAKSEEHNTSPTKEEQNTSAKTEEALEMTEDATSELHSPKEETKLFLQSESKSPKNEQQKKTANGAVAGTPGKKKGLNSERREPDVSPQKKKSTDKIM